MKKRFIAVFIMTLCCSTCCLAGCASKVDSTESSQEPSNTPTKISAPYAAADLETVLFTDAEKALTLDISDNQHLTSLLLSVEYYEPDQKAEPDISQENASYILSLRNVELEIYADDLVRFTPKNGADGGTETAVVLQDEFAYLDTIIEGGAVAFDGYNATQTIKAYNAQNAVSEVTEKESFLESLQALRFVKLQNKAHYQTGAATYTVQIDSDKITVYQKFVEVNGELYSIYQGDFDFLGALQYSFSSDGAGWM